MIPVLFYSVAPGFTHPFPMPTRSLCRLMFSSVLLLLWVSQLQHISVICSCVSSLFRPLVIILVAHYCSSPRCLLPVARSFDFSIYSALLSNYPPPPSYLPKSMSSFPHLGPVSKSGTLHLHLVPLSLPRFPFWYPRLV